jgi:hypothetical protein
MTTTKEAYDALRARLESSNSLPPLRWQAEDEDSTGAVALPDTPAPFLYSEFLTLPAELVSFGGGRGANRYRNRAMLDVFVFIPKGWGLAIALDHAETAASLFRSYRDADVSCFAATVHPGGDGAALRPPGLPSEVSNYFWSVCEVDLWFDQIG